MTVIRRESSAESAARFLALRPPSRKRRRGPAKRLKRPVSRRPEALRDATRVLVGAVRIAGLMSAIESAAWVPESPVSAILAASPIAPMPPSPRIFESNAERLRRYRAAAVAKGLCYICRARNVKPGTRYCEACLNRAREYADSIAYKKCQNCMVALGRRKALLCIECSKKSSEHHRRMVKRRNANGICGRCGKAPMASGHRQCVACLDNMRDRTLAVQREAGSKPRLCPVCRELGIDGTGHDKRTHDRWMKRREEWAP